ncbi:MAG: ferredoxin reductase family protein [Betaproteobacteria bacterium]|nr:ferredoxin reductase family protein [Betaproteobacteria bacterium]MDH5221840.1 ferredoxin reductase family protein [Betaproteobacteria bacterium]MDH5350115.1 ferredoxin reductase family protein [Betaproteobacteria bacterium]
MRIALLLCIYLALTLLPVLLAAAQDAPRRAWLDELSSGMAMAGFAILLAEFALSGRWRALSRGIGMDLTMRFHQWMALAALGFLIAHPILYTDYGWRPGPGGSGGAKLTPAGTVTGALAWLLLVMLVFFAWARRQLPWSYEAWRLSHGLGALLVAALGAHHALDTGHYSQQPWLRAFWLAAAALALLTLVRVYLVKPLLQGRWRVAAVTSEAERQWRVVLEPADARGFTFAAGQFAWLKLHRALGRITEHPFSIASAPGQLPLLQFLIKEAGDFTGAIGRVPTGSRAYIDGPYGDFTLVGRAGKGVMLIAGGIGIAPLLSLARDLSATSDARPLKIVYADKSEAQLAARGELESIARGAPGRELHLVLGAHLDQERLRKLLPPADADQWLYFVCGPPAMIDAVELSLARLGVPLKQIVSERFVYDTGIATPRERLTRAVIGAVVLAQALAVIAFVLR